MTKTPRIRPAGFWGCVFLNSFGFAGVTSPWRTIYIHPDWLGVDWLVRHEVAHLAQMQRDGWLKFWAQCLIWYFVPGYDNSPYEIEARAVEHDPHHPLLSGWALPC